MRFIILLCILLAITISGFVGFGSHLAKNQVVSVDAVYDRPVHMVWQLMTDYAAMPSWSKTIEKAEKLPDTKGKPTWHLVYKDGHFADIFIDEVVENQQFKTTLVDSDLPYSGSVLTEMTQINETKTEVKITADLTIKGVFKRLFMHYFQKNDEHVNLIVQETGEELAKRPIVMPAVTKTVPVLVTTPPATDIAPVPVPTTPQSQSDNPAKPQ